MLFCVKAKRYAEFSVIRTADDYDIPFVNHLKHEWNEVSLNFCCLGSLLPEEKESFVVNVMCCVSLLAMLLQITSIYTLCASTFFFFYVFQNGCSKGNSRIHGYRRFLHWTMACWITADVYVLCMNWYLSRINRDPTCKRYKSVFLISEPKPNSRP